MSEEYAAMAWDKIKRLGAEIDRLRAENQELRAAFDNEKHLCDIFVTEREHARKCYHNAINVLTAIHNLLYPKYFTDSEGRIWQFKSPIVEEQMQALSDRIRSIPEELRKIDTNLKEVKS